MENKPNIDKIIIAPQIVVYKNIFKNSNELVNTLASDNPGSTFSNWRKWYEQGYRKEADLYQTTKIELNDSEIIKKEKTFLKEIQGIIELIQKDYFDSFRDGIWPDFIKDWNKLKEKKNLLYIDYFKYDIEKIGVREDLMMDYHVDEFLSVNETKTKRHVITINLYLNDDYDGGEICAYDSISDKSYKYKPRPGDIVVMPSTEPFYHAVKSFSNADRYFLRTFIDYEIEAPIEQKKENNKVDGMNEEEQEYVKNDSQILNKIIAGSEIEVNDVQS